jgi:hypothetical protein
MAVKRRVFARLLLRNSAFITLSVGVPIPSPLSGVHSSSSLPPTKLIKSEHICIVHINTLRGSINRPSLFSYHLPSIYCIHGISTPSFQHLRIHIHPRISVFRFPLLDTQYAVMLSSLPYTPIHISGPPLHHLLFSQYKLEDQHTPEERARIMGHPLLLCRLTRP